MIDPNMKFKAYEDIGRKSGDSYISIGKNGRFGFSSEFIKKYFKKKPLYVYFNTAEDEYNIYFGFGFGDEENKPNKMKLMYPKEKSWNCIAMSSNIFKDFKKYLEGKSGKRFKPQVHEDENFGKLYVIEIQK